MNSLFNSPLRRFRRGTYLFIIVFTNLLGVVYYFWFFNLYGYLPRPFFFVPSDTFMDLFNPMFWAFDEGRYTEWGSVYPPLNFVILKVLNILFMGDVSKSPFLMRDESVSVIFGYFLIYISLPIMMLCTGVWVKFSKIEKIFVYFAIVFSAPMLFALERGNLIILCPIFLSLVLSGRLLLRCLAIALLINLKPYFVVLLLLFVVRRNFSGFFICVLFSGVICLATGLIIDDYFLLFLVNMIGFSEGGIFSLREVLHMPTSISAYSYVLSNEGGGLFASRFVGRDILPIIVCFIESIKWVVICFNILTIFFKKSVIRDSEIVLLIILVLTNFGISAGGYSFIFYAALVPVFMDMRFGKIYFILLLLIALPLDVMPLTGSYLGSTYSYVSDSYVQLEWTLGLGSVVRPFVNILLLFLVSFEVILRRRSFGLNICIPKRGCVSSLYSAI